MELMQFMFGLASATEVAYYTYMYAQVRNICFLKLSLLLNTTYLGKFILGAKRKI